MSTTLYASRRNLNDFLTDILNVPSSIATIQTHLEEMSTACEGMWHQARRAVQHAPIIGVDETGWRLGRLPRWIWVAQSPGSAVFFLRERRDKQTAQEVMTDCKADVIITDRYNAYKQIDATRHQICRAHLLRDWKKLARAGPFQAIGEALVMEEKNLHRAHRTYRAGELTWAVFSALANELRDRQKLLCLQVGAGDGTAVARWFLKPEGVRAWTFLQHPRCPLTNNASERAVRPCVIQRKLSFGSKSDAGLLLMQRLWTVRSTAKLQRTHLFSLLRDALLASRQGAPSPLLISLAP